MSVRSKILGIAVVIGLIGAGEGFPSTPAADTKIVVVATNSILSDLVKNVGGEFVELYTMVGPNADVHTFEPSPQDNIVLAKANVIFEIGLHLEPWLADLYASSGSQAQRYRVSEGVELIRVKDADSKDPEIDPHVWHDVSNAMTMVVAIRDALIKDDSVHAQNYRDNADSYLKKLAALDDRVMREVSRLPAERRKLVTSHDTFGYFARRYGFEIAGAAIDSATTEAADPSALKTAQLVEKVKAAAVPAVFMENVSNPKLIEAIAREAGVKVAPKLYSDALGEPGSSGEDYIQMMTYNVQVIVEALK